MSILHMFIKIKKTIKNVYQKIVNAKIEKLDYFDFFKNLVDEYVMIEKWTLNRENWIYIMKSHNHASKKNQIVTRQYQYNQKRVCYVLRFRVFVLTKKITIVVKQIVVITIIQIFQKIRFEANNIFELISNTFYDIVKRIKKNFSRIIISKNDDDYENEIEN